MKSLLKSLRESKATKFLGLIGLLSSCVILDGCANTDPNAAMATTVAGVLLGGMPGASVADMAVGQALTTGGALSYQRGAYENAARHVGSGNQNTITYLVPGGQTPPARERKLLMTSAEAREYERQKAQQVLVPECFTCTDYTDINGDGYIDDNEIFGRKNTFDIDTENLMLVVRNMPLGNVKLSSWNNKGKLIGETIWNNRAHNGFSIWGILPTEKYEEEDFLVNLREHPSGIYRIVISTRGRLTSTDVLIRRSKE